MAGEQVNVLLVDDRPSNLVALEAILADLGLKLVKANSGEEALRCLLQADFALILMDVVMPTLDGIETAKLIGQRQRSRHTPIIFLTAQEQGASELFRGYAVGAVDYLVKPIVPSILRSKVAVFVELFRKTEQVKRQAELLREQQLHEQARLLEEEKRRWEMERLRREAVQERENADAMALKAEELARALAELQEAQAALHESEGRFRALFDQAVVGIAQTDLRGQFLAVNQRLCEIVGRTRDEVLRLRMQDLTHPADLPDNLAQFETLAAGGPPFIIEKRYLRPDGSHVWVCNSVSLVTSAGGRPPCIAAVVFDITDRKKAEEALRETSRRKDEFLAMLGHELRNPLASLRTGLEVLRRSAGEEAGAVQEYEMMARQIRHLTRLVDDLLDVSRITRGKIALQLAPCALADVIANAVETSQPLLAANRHQFRLQLPAELVQLQADAERLAQVFANLLRNAAKYTEPGGRIELSAEVKHGYGQPAEEVIVRVRDTGIGIAAEMLPSVFELFVQADHSLARSGGGLGIGLTLVRNLVELHGGRVEAASAGLGQGSEFTVTLPWVRAAAPAQTQAAAEPARLVAPRLSVLVVDDNQDAARSMAMLLRMAGHEVHLAHDGPSALQAAERHHPQVVLLDIGLPGLDGYEVARRLRRQPEFARTLVVAMTGYGQEEDRRQSRAAGIDHHFVKPIDPETLLDFLANPSSLSRLNGETPSS
jgi:PAS domain S-box-containing protein